MSLIPSGQFTMGSPVELHGAREDEFPRHPVNISKPFYIGKYEVTQAQWQAIMGYNPVDDYEANMDFYPYVHHINKPVVNVTWDDCQDFIQKINEKGWGTFRLPTEAEWEYACRAGTTTPFYWGSDGGLKYIQKYSPFIQEVGLKLPNAWNLFDMIGNVFEFCYDWYGPYSSEYQIDPVGPEIGKNKVIRGGYIYIPETEMRSAARAHYPLDEKSAYGGLRIVKEYCTNFSTPTINIYDTPDSTDEDYTGKTDFDAVDERNLTLRWNIPAWDGTSWDVYVRDGLGGYQFLARAALDANQLDWFPGAANIAAKFASGPEFGHVYRFRVVRLAWPIGPEDVYDQTAATGFAMESATAPDLAPPVMPNLNPGQIAVYDDLLGGNDLAPQNGSGSDADKSTQRAIQIAWNFGSNLADVSDYRVLVKVNEQGEFQPLGNTNSGNITYYYWSPKETFYTAKEFSPGPQTGNSYRFKVVEFNPKNKVNAELTTGLLNYTEEGE
ncbi:MAG: formylglycine-generating enzyme family protein [Candidatus Omnitrophota bacterium]